MKVHEFLQVFEQIAPLALAEPWDKVGLQVGSSDADFSKTLLTIDLTHEVAAEAIRLKCGLVVCYHPFLFDPVQTVTSETGKGAILLELIRAGVNVFSPHTALDAAVGGINDWLAQGVAGVGLEGFTAVGVACRPIKPSKVGATAGDTLAKVVVFVPESRVDAVRHAMAEAGAGRIGNYTQCSFETRGVGTFLGNQSASPKVGQAGTFERVDEVRLEMVAPLACVPQVVRAMRLAHPYEEPAFDVFRQETVVKTAAAAAQDASSSPVTGAGRVVELPKPITLVELGRRMQKHLGVSGLHLGVTGQGVKQKVQRIGICAGAGASLIKEAGAIDAFITGEMRHHDQLDAVGRGIGLILAGHTQTERPYLPVLKARLVAQMKVAGYKAGQVLISSKDKSPVEWM
jgi:dinuclear metal center YbgI/SA1388 family protein